MKKILIINLSIILTILFTGCGSGGSSENTNSDISIVTCMTNDSVTNTTWSTVSSNQTVTVTVGTELLWKQTDIKQVCVKTGTGSATVK